MEKLEKKVRTFTIVGILLLIAFIAGIPMTVLGATKGITALLVIGIVFIVAGFYVSPIMLVQVTEKRKLKRVIMAVEKQNLYSVDDIAAGTGLNQKAVRGYLNESMQKGAQPVHAEVSQLRRAGHNKSHYGAGGLSLLRRDSQRDGRKRRAGSVGRSTPD